MVYLGAVSLAGEVLGLVVHFRQRWGGHVDTSESSFKGIIGDGSFL